MTALYLHFPWCVQKCPYCDFNSRPRPSDWEEAPYLAAVRRDLEIDLRCFNLTEPITSIFFGGGSPSLLSPAGLATLLEVVARTPGIAAGAEITIEANPGNISATIPAQWLSAGINRVSLGVQSFTDDYLRVLGRIHSAQTARTAIQTCLDAGFTRLNVDLMYGLPGQTLAQAQADLDAALAFAPGHLSCYQLTIEPETPFGRRNLILPDESFYLDWLDLQAERMAHAGYAQYEISAWAKPSHESSHNLNYWRFGDYLGVGPGAHGKLTRADGSVCRTVKEPDPARYIALLTAAESEHEQNASTLCQIDEMTPDDLRLEYLLNVLRLKEGFTADDFTRQTHQPFRAIEPTIERALAYGLLIKSGDLLRPTVTGRRMLDEWLVWFD